MTLKELLDKVSELCNDETKDLPVKVYNDEGDLDVITEIYHYKFRNDYSGRDEIRII